MGWKSQTIEIKLSVPVNHDTVWLTQDQMSELFDT